MPREPRSGTGCSRKHPSVGDLGHLMKILPQTPSLYRGGSCDAGRGERGGTLQSTWPPFQELLHLSKLCGYRCRPLSDSNQTSVVVEG